MPFSPHRLNLNTSVYGHWCLLGFSQGRENTYSATWPSEQFSENSLTTQTTQLTTQLNPEEIFKEEIHYSRTRDDPFPDKTPAQLLTREYLVFDDSFLVDEFHVLYPHGLLLQKDTIAKYLSRFSLFRADLKIRIELISSPMQYGNFFVSMLPYQKGASDFLTVTQQSQASLHNLDIGLQQALDLKLPYLSPKLYWDLTNLTDSPAWRIMIRCDTLNTLTTNAPTSVRLKMYASFENPEAAGYRQAVLQSARVLDRRFSFPAAAAAGMNAVGTMVRSGLTSVQASAASNPAAAAAGVSAAAAGVKLATAAAEAVKATKKVDVPPANTKLDICCDLSAPSGASTSALLGDPIIRDYTHLPPDCASTLQNIVSVPTLIYQDSLAYGTPKVLEVDPFELGTYSHYVSKMYKHYRGSQQLLFRFITAPSISTRVQITLYPTLAPSVGEVDTEGDLPTMILSLRGTTTATLDVPYLSTKPWTSVFSPYKPMVKITMLDPMIQQFDKAPVLYMDIYQRAAPDFQFSGLQSFVPQNAVMQSWVSDEFEPYNSQTIHSYPYQGHQSTVASILARFSSRDPDPDLLFPFPVKIADWSAAWKLDNFDYVSNLYAFYTGDTRVKMLFSKGAANGLLRICVGNSNTHTGPKDTSWKSSNSMVLTDQSVWPILEYEYPYQNEYEYDSIWYPNTMYPQNVDQTAELDTYFIAASDEFRLFYLLPIPTFALEEPEPEAIMQSQSRFVGSLSYAGVLSVIGPSSGIGTAIVSSFDWSQMFYLEFDAYVFRLAGNTDFTVACSLGTANEATPSSWWATQPLCAFGLWSDSSNSGKHVLHLRASGVFANVGTTAPLRFSTSTLSTVVDYAVYYTVRVRPWSQASLLVSPQHTTDCAGVITSSPSLPLSVNSTVTLPDPLPVTVTNSPSVTVSNMISEPVSVSVVNDFVPVEGNLRVQGLSDPDTPVWTTSYRPS